jgi:hypothetical protein
MNPNDTAEYHKPPMSDLGKSLFEMMTAINTAASHQQIFDAMDRIDQQPASAKGVGHASQNARGLSGQA